MALFCSRRAAEKAVKTYVDANNVSFYAYNSASDVGISSGYNPVDFDTEMHDDGNNFLADKFR